MNSMFFLCFVGVDNGLIPMMTSQDGIPPPDPLRLDWPKVTKNILLMMCLNLFIFDLFCQRVSLMCNLLTPRGGLPLLQDRVLINRLDSLCTMVVSGQWPSGRRYMSETQLNPSSEFTGDEMAYARMIRKPAGMPGGPGADGEDGEFTVKLLKVGLFGGGNAARCS